MSAAILANMAILLLAILLFFFLRKGKVLEPIDSPLELFGYILGVTVVGVCLMKYSVVVSGARYDYRFLVYALSIKYLGPKVTLPSIGIITLARFIWGVDVSSFSALCFGLILMATILAAYRYLARYFGSIGQVVGLIFYMFVVRIILNTVIYHNMLKDIQLYIILISSSILMFWVLFFVFSRIVQIQERSEIDFLTQLRNSRRFYQDIAKMERDSRKIVLGIIDIDHFKQVNTQYGHLAGDQVLQLLSKTFLELQSQSFIFYRMGGEEFSFLCYGKTLDEAAVVIDRLRQTVSNLDSGLNTPEKEIYHITFSAGLTLVDKHHPISEALAQADRALYTAKDSGRNRLVLMDPI